LLQSVCGQAGKQYPVDRLFIFRWVNFFAFYYTNNNFTTIIIEVLSRFPTTVVNEYPLLLIQQFRELIDCEWIPLPRT